MLVAMMTLDEFKLIMPHCEHPAVFHPALNQAMAEAEVNTVTRAAAFLGQIAHESGECRYLEEWGDGERYEGRTDLGNVYPGDGPRYKGHGLIQLTGRKNHRLAGKALGIDLELYPEEATKPLIAARVAAWYWREHKCNELADRPDFQAVTRAINGGLNGLVFREKYYRTALEILGRHARIGG